MRRTTSLTAALLAGFAPAVVLLAPSAASGTGETCRGEAATLVGTGGARTIRGTEGRDVVVTHGSNVNTLGGDDLVCVTGTTTEDHMSVNVQTGAGDDVVDGTTSRGWGVRAELGEGADRFEGGDDQNYVYGGYDGSSDRDTEVDVILGGTGQDIVESGSAGPNGDRIELGAGHDHVGYFGTMSPGGSVSGGEGSDSISLETEAGSNRIDNVAGQLVVNGAATVLWTGMESFYASAAHPVGPRHLELVGTDAPERLVDWDADSGRATLDFGGGDDAYLAAGPPTAGSRIDAGTGDRDFIYLASARAGVDLDLSTGGLAVAAAAPYTLEAPGFDGASVFAPKVVLAGTDADDYLGLTACEGIVRGRGGDDTVERTYDSWFETDLDCAERFVVSGGGGDDRIRGTRGGDDVLRGGGGRDRLDGNSGDDRLLGGGGNDVLLGSYDADTLIGGPGRDRADGDKGRDRCVAESEKNCER